MDGFELLAKAYEYNALLLVCVGVCILWCDDCAAEHPHPMTAPTEDVDM